MSELDARFTSPGLAISSQIDLERKLERALRSSTEEMLREIRSRTLSRSISSSDCSELWSVAVDKALIKCGFKAGSDEYKFLNDELIQAKIGDEAYQSATAVLRSAAETYPAPSQSAIEKMLDEALDLETPSMLAAGTVDPKKLFKSLKVLGSSWSTRLKRTVRTGYTGFSGFIALNAIRSARRVSKTWVTRHDDDVRSSHLEIDGTTIPVESTFDVGGERLMYPGDRTGTLEQIANCRCVMVSSH